MNNINEIEIMRLVELSDAVLLQIRNDIDESIKEEKNIGYKGLKNYTHIQGEIIMLRTYLSMLSKEIAK